jgi:hypothetical protein
MISGKVSLIRRPFRWKGVFLRQARGMHRALSHLCQSGTPQESGGLDRRPAADAATGVLHTVPAARIWTPPSLAVQAATAGSAVPGAVRARPRHGGLQAGFLRIGRPAGPHTFSRCADWVSSTCGSS